jgi:hypothetical protein
VEETRRTARRPDPDTPPAGSPTEGDG